jgi:radical SAM protein with 4Fe4S-binding SPASM domain
MQDVSKLIDLAVKENVNALTVERVTPCGNAHDMRKNLLTSHEVKAVYEFISKRANDSDVVESGLVIRRSRPLWINTLNQDDKKTNDSKIGGFCPVGLTSLAILADGTVLPCRRLNIPIGNILKDGLFKIWYTSEVLWEIRNKSNLKGKCYSCENIANCGGCRAIAYEITGDYMGEDCQCWKK